MRRSFFEMSICLSCSGIRWEGQGWWEVTPGQTDWAAVTTAVSRSVFGAIGSVVGNDDYRFDLTGQVFTVDDALASKIDEHTKRYAVDDLRQVVWSIKEVRVERKARTVRHDKAE